MAALRSSEPPVVPVRRHAYDKMSMLFLTVASHVQAGAVARMDYGWGREPVDIVANAGRYLVRGVYGPERQRVVGTFDTIGQAVMAADTRAEPDDGLGGDAA